MFKLLMSPSNAVCNRLGLIDEHERGMMRMLVNMMIICGLMTPFIYAGYRILGAGR
jgi:hypothetical protein